MPTKPKTFKQLLKDFEIAVAGKALLGASDPDDYDEIRSRYKQAKRDIIKAVEDLYQSFKRHSNL